jgi:predicted RNA-binding Zn-ribbon protein involved in translation (DUF1610 family)
MSRHSPKEIERIKRIAAKMTPASLAQGSLAAPSSSASVLELGHAKSDDAHCLACGFEMVGGRYVGLCPKCGSDRWYRTRLEQSPKTGLGAGGAQLQGCGRDTASHQTLSPNPELRRGEKD